MTDEAVSIVAGIPTGQEATAARLYCDAFAAKLSPFLGPPERAARALAPSLATDRAIVAVRGGAVIGIAGFKVGGRGLFEPTVRQMIRAYGWSGPLRLLALAVLDRREAPDSLLMDGIAVDAAARGLGIGTRLLAAIQDHARALGRTSVRLDVIDTNPAARRLYDRFGFVAERTTGIGPLRIVFPFRATTTMRLAVDTAPP
ncbi:GNAT family N-acetyltransferase [Bauldia sp.]|uniref:GNAT family N-acetyltransferase n=1 Tax=Bauldia sp. TaxID=2575872 RepID=UPI003BA8EB7B